jgi:hypothetical protein
VKDQQKETAPMISKAKSVKVRQHVAKATYSWFHGKLAFTWSASTLAVVVASWRARLP